MQQRHDDPKKRQSFNKMKCISKEISFEEKLSRVNNNYFNSKYFKVLNKKGAKKQNPTRPSTGVPDATSNKKNFDQVEKKKTVEDFMNVNTNSVPNQKVPDLIGLRSMDENYDRMLMINSKDSGNKKDQFVKPQIRANFVEIPLSSDRKILHSPTEKSGQKPDMRSNGLLNSASNIGGSEKKPGKSDPSVALGANQKQSNGLPPKDQISNHEKVDSSLLIAEKETNINLDSMNQVPGQKSRPKTAYGANNRKIYVVNMNTPNIDPISKLPPYGTQQPNNFLAQNNILALNNKKLQNNILNSNNKARQTRPHTATQATRPKGNNNLLSDDYKRNNRNIGKQGVGVSQGGIGLNAFGYGVDESRNYRIKSALPPKRSNTKDGNGFCTSELFYSEGGNSKGNRDQDIFKSKRITIKDL